MTYENVDGWLRTILEDCREHHWHSRAEAVATAISLLAESVDACKVSREACRDNLAMAAIKDEPKLLAAFTACDKIISRAETGRIVV